MRGSPDTALLTQAFTEEEPCVPRGGGDTGLGASPRLVREGVQAPGVGGGGTPPPPSDFLFSLKICCSQHDQLFQSAPDTHLSNCVPYIGFSHHGFPQPQ